MSYLQYKGYLGTIEPNLEDGTLFGKLAFIRELVTYEADNLTNLQSEFEFSVEGYLADCKELGIAPSIPLKGSFNVRISPDLHRKAVMAAGDKSLNAFVAEAIEYRLAQG